MPAPVDYPATGKVLAVEADAIIFNPAQTTYQLRLLTPGGYQGPVNQPIQGMIRALARKLYTVPSGGNFIDPIFGPPRIIQGRIRFLDQQQMVVQAGTFILVELPAEDSAYDMGSGPLVVGGLVNCMAMPGARFEDVKPAAEA
jgi:hypothetical protein